MAGTTFTRTQVRQEGLKQWQSLGWAATADSVTTTAIVDVSEFDHSSYGSNEFSSYYINRYNLTGNDKVKRVGKASLTQSTGTLAHDSATVYVDTSDKDYELLGVPPQVLDDGIATAQQNRYTQQIRLLTRAIDAAGNAADMDMATSGVSMWNGVTAGSASSATPTKVTTAANVTNLLQSLNVALSGANGYVRSARFRVNPNESFYTCLIGRADVGTLTFKMYDVTNSAYIDTSRDVAYTGEQFALLQRRDIAPSGCEEVQIEIRGTGASDVLIVQGISGPWPRSTRRIELPSSINEQYKLRFLKPADYMPITGVANLYDAESRHFIGDYVQPQDFFVETFHREVNAYHIQLVNDALVESLQDRPMWMALERSRALDEPLTTESGTTTESDLNDLMNYVFLEWATTLSIMRPDEKKWADLKAEYTQKTAVTIFTHPPPPKVAARGMQVVRI